MTDENVYSQRHTSESSTLIATPVWRENPTSQEIEFLRRTDLSNTNVDRWLCAPEGLDASFYRERFPDWRVRRFPDSVFSSVSSYSQWLTEPDFYEAVADFQFVTICQLDAVLIKDVTEIDMRGLDYLGSAWVPPLKVLTPGNRIYVASEQGESQGMWLTRQFGRSLHVGNGGLSVRRVEAHLRATQWLTRHLSDRYRKTTLEDVLLCAFAHRYGLRIASPKIANGVFLETGAQGLRSVPNVFGFHGLHRWNPALVERLRAQAS